MEPTSHGTWQMEHNTVGPLGDCEVNTLAMCLPREDCYEFTVMDRSNNDGSKGNGLFTVTFSHIDDTIQSYLGSVADVTQRFSLAHAILMNFGLKERSRGRDCLPNR